MPRKTDPTVNATAACWLFQECTANRRDFYSFVLYQPPRKRSLYIRAILLTALVHVADKASTYYWINETTGELLLRPGAYGRGAVNFTVRVSVHLW